MRLQTPINAQSILQKLRSTIHLQNTESSYIVEKRHKGIEVLEIFTIMFVKKM